ncbi:MAG: HAMP domain-containing sensor histidine kinase, partial [Planctomycetota bacterium]
TYYVQLAASRRPVQEIVAQLRRMLVSFVLISLAAAALTSWYLARRSLAPLGEVVRQARALGASRLEERLPVPRSGDEVAEMVVVVNEMLARLEAEFRNQQRFIADVSHELRTPVAVLLGEAQALKRRVGDPAVCQVFAGTVEEEARRLLRTVEAFLVLTRVRAGGRPPVLRDVSMEETVLNAVQKAQAEARARQVTILPRFSSSETSSEPHVAGDPELLYALVVNLLRHAIQHSPARAAVEVEVLATTRDLTLHVRDSGPPIPPEQLLRIFDLLRRVRPGADGGVDTGVGLAVVKGVAQLYGGSTEVRNRNDGGCEFTVRLPLTARTQTGAAR